MLPVRQKLAGRSHSATLIFAYCRRLLSSISGDGFESEWVGALHWNMQSPNAPASPTGPNKPDVLYLSMKPDIVLPLILMLLFTAVR